MILGDTWTWLQPTRTTALEGVKGREALCLFYVHGWSTNMYACAPCEYSANRGQRNTSDALDLELQLVVHCQVQAENWTWVLW